MLAVYVCVRVQVGSPCGGSCSPRSPSCARYAACRSLLRKNPAQRLGAGGNAETGGRVIMNHPWFGASRVNDIRLDKVAPPFVPGKDINTNSQQSIGSFCDDTSKIVIEKNDDLALKPWNFTSKTAFNHEMIVYLKYESEQVGKVKFEGDGRSPCCNIS